MKKFKYFLLGLLFISQLTSGCKKDPKVIPTEPDKELAKVEITVDKSTKYQTIDGFGFFGSYDVWWGSPGNMWNDAWGEKVISDLGITIWRNEWYPPAIPGANQDADWNKQKPVVQGLKAKADKYGVNLKYVVTVWSPPAEMKWTCSFTWAGDENATRTEETVSTKNGGTLNPNKYEEYAQWLNTCLQSHKDLGIDVYALSLQNEPMFKQSFNSCTYTTAWYCELLDNVVPKIKTSFPNVKIFGSENMLDMEGKSENWPYFYHQAIKNSATAKNNIDIFAVHGYSDGVAASSGSALAQMWENHKNQFSKPMNKPAWMTETSGYVDTWAGSNKPGALSLAMDIYSGLNFGDMQAWVWWQGSQSDGIGEFNLMSNNGGGKKYYVSKHYYRYIRPGAVRVKATSSDPNIFVTAFEHATKGTHTLVIINNGDEAKSVSLEGTGLPASFAIYRTTSGADNCKEVGTATSGAENLFELPAKSIVTLQAGGDAL